MKIQAEEQTTKPLALAELLKLWELITMYCEAPNQNADKLTEACRLVTIVKS